jgi:hypothetical protein
VTSPYVVNHPLVHSLPIICLSSMFGSTICPAEQFRAHIPFLWYAKSYCNSLKLGNPASLAESSRQPTPARKPLSGDINSAHTLDIQPCRPSRPSNKPPPQYSINWSRPPPMVGASVVGSYRFIHLVWRVTCGLSRTCLTPYHTPRVRDKVWLSVLLISKASLKQRAA